MNLNRKREEKAIKRTFKKKKRLLKRTGDGKSLSTIRQLESEIAELEEQIKDKK